MKRYPMNICKLILLLGVATCSLSAQWLSGSRFLSSNTAGASTCWQELYTNGSAAVCLKAPDSITTEFTLTFPSALPTSTTRCLEVTTSGVIQYASAACGTGSGSGYTTIKDFGSALTARDTLHFVAPAFFCADDSTDGGDGDGLETECNLVTFPTNSATLVGTGLVLTATTPITIAGTTSADLSANRTLACPTCVTTNTAQTISGIKTHTASIIIRDTNELILQNNTGTLTSHKLGYSSANISVVRNSASGIFLTFNSAGATQLLGVTGTIYPGGDDLYDIGTPSLEWRNGYFDGTLQTDLLQVDSTSTFAAAATFNGGITQPATTNSTIRVGDSGNLWLRSISGAPTCTGDGDGSMADGDTDGLIYYDYTNNRIYICDGTEERFIDLGT